MKRIALLCGMMGSSAIAAPPAAEPKAARKRPVPPIQYVAGVPVRPVADLLVWLKAQPGRLRLPVWVQRVGVVPFDQFEAAVGGIDGLVLRLDDSGMGISLRETLGRRCPTGACMIWTEGYWGATVPSVGPTDQGGWPFSVRAVGEPVKPDETLRVWVEGGVRAGPKP